MSAAASVDTRVTVGSVALPNPVLAASGTFGYGTEYQGLVDLAALGALCVKGLSLRPAPGKPAPRLVETPGGVLNAIGRHDLPFVFGGDGALVAVPALQVGTARAAHSAVQRWSMEELKLDMRGAVIPVSTRSSLAKIGAACGSEELSWGVERGGY